MPGEKVSYLCPKETVDLNGAVARTYNAKADAAPRWADDAIEDMIVSLSTLEAAWRSGEFSRLGRLADTLMELSFELGLTMVARIAGETARLASGGDDIALAAVVARLVRVGESSLAAMIGSDYQHI